MPETVPGLKSGINLNRTAANNAGFQSRHHLRAFSS